MIRLGVIMPAYQAEPLLERSLKPLIAAAREHELLVVDPGSEDRTASLARELGAEVLELGRRAGPAEARNEGVQHLTDVDVVLFIDSDCVIHEDVIQRVAAAFDRDPELVSLTGSYDDNPPERNFASLYMNLRHHFVHQRARTENASFWAGCGAVRRDAFLQAGGFDAKKYPRPMIEDIELGQRLAPLGAMRLDPELHVTHLKRWTIRSVIHTDIFCRAFPWSRLILESGEIPDNLNVSARERVAAVFGFLSVDLVLVGLTFLIQGWSVGLWMALVGALLPYVFGLELFAFFAKRGGLFFATEALSFHQLHLTYSLFTFVWCKVQHILGGTK